jgi:integrase
MNRPRRVNPDGLPPCCYWKNGAFWLVKKRKWTRLGADRREALVEYARITSAPKTGSMPGLIDRVLKYHIKAEQLSEQTANAYQSAAKRLKEVFRDFEPEQVRPKHVAALRVADAETPGAANRNQTVLKIVFRYAMEEGLVDSNPVIGARTFKMPKRRRYISSAEFWRIHAQAGERLRVIMELCFYTWQRIGDVLGIKFDDLGEDWIYFDQ